MYQFHTANGSTYTVEDGRISRHNFDVRIVDQHGDETDQQVVAEPFTLVYKGAPTSPPTVGEQFFYSLASGGMRTGFVVRITTECGWSTGARGETCADLHDRIASIRGSIDQAARLAARRRSHAVAGFGGYRESEDMDLVRQADGIDHAVANRIIDAYAAGQPGARYR